MLDPGAAPVVRLGAALFAAAYRVGSMGEVNQIPPLAASASARSSSLPSRPPLSCRSPNTSIRSAAATPPTFTASKPAAEMSRSAAAAAVSSSLA